MDELIKMFREQEYQRILEEARRKAQSVDRPTFPSAVLHGASLGYLGTPGEGISGTVGELLGSTLPYGLASMATGGAVLPLAARLGLAAKNAAGVMSIPNPVYQALLHGGMTGALAGGARRADDLTDRLQNVAVEGTLGALVPAGLAKIFKPKASLNYEANVKPEAVPDDWLHAKGRVEPIPGTSEKFIEPDRFYAPGSYSKLLGHGTQLEIPGIASYTPKDMRAEAEMLKRLSVGNIQADLPFDVMGQVKATAQGKGAKGQFLKKKVYEIDETKTPFVSAKPTGQITNLIDSTVQPELSGVALRQGMFKEASTMPEQLRKLVPKGPGQVELPFPKKFETDFPSLATQKGFDIHSADGRLRLVGLGGKTEVFDSIDDAVGFLRLQPPAKQLPVELYGTMDKMINKPPGGRWTDGTYKWTKLDDAALRMQKMQNQWVDTPIGNDISEGIKPLNERMRINVLTGIQSAEGAQAAAAAAKAKGYDAYPLVFGDSIEVAYMNPKDKFAMDVFNQYNILRNQGPRGLGSRSGDALRHIGAAFGKTPEEVERYGWQLLLKEAPSAQKTFLLGMFETPQFHRDPLFQQVAWKVTKAETAMEVQASWARNNFFKKYINKLSKEDHKKFINVAQGELDIADAPAAVQDAAKAWFAIRADLAERLDISPIKNYFTHKTDYDALWATTKKSLLDPAQTEMWQKKLGTDGVNALKQLRMQAVEFNDSPWTSIPSSIRNSILQQTMKWDVGSWDKLPPYLRNSLPEEIFNPYVIPRVKDSKVPYLTDVKDVLESYIDKALRDIHYTPILKEVKPVIDKLPGAGVPGSQRTLIEEYISKVATRSPNAYQQMLNNVFNETGRNLGLPFADENTLSKIITFYRGREYGGLIGIDTAFRHMNKVINVMAENGMFVANALKKLPYEIYARASDYVRPGSIRHSSMPKLPGVMGQVLPLEEQMISQKGKAFMDRAINVSNMINTTMFTPMMMVENGLRSLSALSALDEGLARGLDYKKVMRLAMGRASSIMPEVGLTEAQMHAMRNVLRTDFGYTSSAMPTLWSNPLARVSSLFLSYPSKEIEFLAKGIGSGINGYLSVGQTAGTAAGMQAFEGSQLFRYLIATGMLFGLPAVTAKYMGIDSTRFFGSHMFEFSMPFYQRIMNAYNALAGDDPITRDQARTALIDSVNSLVVPQYRMGKKFLDTYESLDRGYKVDQAGHKIATATPIGELYTYMGLRPVEYTNPKIIANEWREIAHDYNRERTYATSEFIRTGRMDEIQKWEKKWARTIEPKDLAHAIEIANMPPEKRAQIGLAYDTIKQQLQQKPWLIGGM